MIYLWKFALVSFLGIASCHEPPQIYLHPLGYVQGTTMPGYQTEEMFEAFMGIPFAQAPVGDLRFANPRPITPWNDVYLADAPKADCIQKDYVNIPPLLKGEEDCLYLNIYRPSRVGKSDKGLLPVMVFIFGGGFFAGTSSPLSYGPEYFMDTKEVILVVIAYRLGALGFLSTGDSNMPGNFGLKDQNMALKWVQKYISYFGGCPDNVTIFGHSAGAISVHLHMLSDLSTGLFQRAIVMSGNARSEFGTPLADPLSQARKQAEFCNITNASTLNSKTLTEALRSIDARQLVHSGDGFKSWTTKPLIIFRPTIESPSEPSAFLTKNPLELMSSGNFTQVPWITGFVPHEGGVSGAVIVANETLRKSFNADFDNVLQLFMNLPPMDEDDMRKVTTSVVDFYFDGVHQMNNENAQGLIDLITDRSFLQPFYRSVKDYVATADLEKSPIYLYKFNYRGLFSYSFPNTGSYIDFGVSHSDDLIYLFRSPQVFNAGIDRNSTDARVIKEMVSTFVSFAKTGKPNGMKECTKEILGEVGDDEFCDYKEIINVEKGFMVRTANKFDMAAINLWESILQVNRSGTIV